MTPVTCGLHIWRLSKGFAMKPNEAKTNTGWLSFVREHLLLPLSPSYPSKVSSGASPSRRAFVLHLGMTNAVGGDAEGLGQQRVWLEVA